MLQLNVIRQDPEKIKERLAIKYFTDVSAIDELLKWDEKRKQYQHEQDTLQSKINAASKEIGQLMAKGDKEAAETKKQEVASLKSQLSHDKLTDA